MQQFQQSSRWDIAPNSVPLSPLPSRWLLASFGSDQSHIVLQERRRLLPPWGSCSPPRRLLLLLLFLAPFSYSSSFCSYCCCGRCSRAGLCYSLVNALLAADTQREPSPDPGGRTPNFPAGLVDWTLELISRKTAAGVWSPSTQRTVPPHRELANIPTVIVAYQHAWWNFMRIQEELLTYWRDRGRGGHVPHNTVPHWIYDLKHKGGHACNLDQESVDETQSRE